MRQRLRGFFSTPFQLVLVLSFSLIAAITIAIGTWAIAQTINDYLSEAMNERVARDIQLAETFVDLKLNELEGITTRLSRNSQVVRNLHIPQQDELTFQRVIYQQITNDISSPGLGGNCIIAVLNKEGYFLTGVMVSSSGEVKPLAPAGNWLSLGIFQETLSTGHTIAATEVIASDLLSQIELAEQAKIAILETPKASPVLYDEREGNAGLALVSATPVMDETGDITGAMLAFHLINNDFTIVDRITEIASIDTATIFFGDLRVSTNVMTPEGNRAIGTRVSTEVSDIVLQQGLEYVGTAFVVNENYITRYDPLTDHLGQVIGIIYVGVKQASFQRLLNSFNQRISLVALGTILLTIIITTPVSRMITHPLNQLKVLVAANRKVAEGDMSARVPVLSGGEVGLLENSFNSMLDTLQITQDQLVQSEKLASLGQLAAGVAHELNNPLGTILLYSDIILKELNPDSIHRADVEIIVNETKRCKGIVAALLEFARQNQVVTQPTELNALIHSVAEMALKHHQNSNVEILYELDLELPIIQADPSQIYQALVNLLDNAFDAMPRGGRIILRTRNHPAGMITLEIEDTGEGIPPENMPRVFTPFFTTKPTGKGTGMGLAIVYGIIKLHRGQINVHSEFNQGTRFTIQLPIKLQGIAAANSSRDDGPAPRKKR
jgi:two-component system NtrC family sensor kinase